MSTALRPPMDHAGTIREQIKKWYAVPEPKPLPRVRYVRLALAPEGGFLLSVRAHEGDGYLFEIESVNLLRDFWALKRAISVHAHLDFSCSSDYWRNVVAPRLLEHASETEEGSWMLR